MSIKLSLRIILMIVLDERKIVLARSITDHGVLLPLWQEGTDYQGAKDEAECDHGVKGLSEGGRLLGPQHPDHEAVTGGVQTSQEDSSQHYH